VLSSGLSGSVSVGPARSPEIAAGFRRICLVLIALSALAAQAQSVPIRSITFEGNQNIDSRRLTNQLRLSRQGGWYQPDTLEMELKNLARFYQDEGFLRSRIGSPSVTFQIDPSEGRVAVIRVPIFEGPLFTVGEVAVKNVLAFKPATLMQMCPVRPGQAYSRRKISEWTDKIKEGYHAMGFIRFESAVREEIHDPKGVVDCTLECREGNAYTVGLITLAGDESIDRADFKRHLLLGEGGLYNPEMLSLSLQFLNQMNVYRPMSESDVELKIDDERSTVDLIFHLFLLRKPDSSPKS
jgi:outer membrane protein insertion porin family